MAKSKKTEKVETKEVEAEKIETPEVETKEVEKKEDPSEAIGEEGVETEWVAVPFTKEDFYKALTKSLGKTITFESPVTWGEDYDNFVFEKDSSSVWLSWVVTVYANDKSLKKQVTSISAYVKATFESLKLAEKIDVSDSYEEEYVVEVAQEEKAVSSGWVDNGSMVKHWRATSKTYS